MTEQEFDILDELYFVQSFNFLVAQLPQYSSQEIKQYLAELWRKGWIKCLDGEHKVPLDAPNIDLNQYYAQYYYLATKEGLLAHNSR